MNKKTILITAGLSDYKLKTKIIGLIDNDLIENIILVRKNKLANTDKISNISPPAFVKRITILFEIWRLLTLIKVARSHNVYAIVGIQLIAHGISAVVAGKLTRTHCVISPIGKDIHYYLKRYFYSFPLRWCIKKASMIAFMGPKSKEILLEQGISNTKLVELKNYHDPNLFRVEKNIQRQDWDFIYIGQLIKRKNIDLIIHAIHKVKTRHPNIKLAIVGTGSNKIKLERLSKSLGLTENIKFLGFRNDINSLLNNSRVFILASEIEALPAAALEAMHSGTPSILTNICDIPGVFIHEYNALLIPPNDINILEEEMTRLCTDINLYNKLRKGCLKSREKYQTNWSLENQIITWKKLLTLK